MFTLTSQLLLSFPHCLHWFSKTGDLQCDVFSRGHWIAGAMLLVERIGRIHLIILFIPVRGYFCILIVHGTPFVDQAGRTGLVVLAFFRQDL